jgi:hypothetical protein
METLITIATFDFPSEADVMKMLLEEQGFKVILADDNLVRTNWFLANAVGGAKLQVLESDAEAAARFVEENRTHARRDADTPQKPDVTFDCEECERSISFPGNRRGYTETCPHCHEYVDVPE